MDKSILLNLLASKAPALLKSIQENAGSNNAGLNPLFAINEAVDRGYDLSLLNDEASKLGMPFSIMPEAMFDDPEGGGIVWRDGSPKYNMSGPGDVFKYQLSDTGGDELSHEDWLKYVKLKNQGFSF